MTRYLVRWEIDIEDACDARDAAQQARAIQADASTLSQTFTVIDSVSEASTVIDLVNVDARLAGARERKAITYDATFTYADLEALPYFAIVEGKSGQCAAGGVRGIDWDLFESVRYCQEVCDELCAVRGISLTDEAPHRIDESARDGYDDLDAALDYLNDGGRLCKVPDTMDPDCADWALYVVR